MEREFYSVRQFAEKLGVSTYTIRRAIRAGRLSAFRAGSTPKSVYRIPHSEIDRLGIVEIEWMIDRAVEKRMKGE